jgi:membrane protease subunit (stomatin/prohibitin family)
VHYFILIFFQIESLKDVVSLTKDMLTIRECEVRDLTERMEAMDVKFKAEKDRKSLMEKKMELSDKLNQDLKAEYKAQKEIFTILKDQYKLKVSSLEEKLKSSTSNGTEAPK